MTDYLEEHLERAEHRGPSDPRWRERAWAAISAEVKCPS